MAKRQIRDYVFTPGIAGVGKVKVLDKIQLNRFLLITNVTQNKILYNFSDPTNQISVVFHPTFDGSDPDFPYSNTISNGITEIVLLFDTSDQFSTDSLQIFIEDEEVKFRPYDFGTDAIERMRVATPQSMLDADFEYGLQPTKWQTVDLMRGYPSIYEVPGSEILLSSITTDASSPTGGIGDSIITVNTSEAHGLTVGSPIRLNGVNDSVSGSSRAEGSFIINTAPSATSFTFYAKGKVGTVNGTSLLTSFTSLRRGGFYTGATIGSPTFTVESQGSSGSFVTNLGIRTSSNRISSTNVSSVVVGSFLSGSASIPTGTQVTGIANTSSTKTFASDVIAPSNTITINGNTNGIVFGSAVDDGTGFASYVTNISDNTITLSDPILVNKIGSSDIIGIVTANPFNFGNGSGFVVNVERNDGRYILTDRIQKTSTGIAGSTYINVGDVIGIFPGSKVVGSGIGIGATIVGFVGIQTAILSVVNSGSVSGIVSFSNPGIGYSTVDRLIIPGNILGGQTPINDLTIKVSSVDSFGGITSFTSSSSKQINAFGEAQLSASQFNDGGTSLLLNPTSFSVDYVKVNSHPDIGFGTEKFTVDFWIYRNRTSATENLFDMRNSTTEFAPSLYIDTSNYLNLFINGSSVITGITTLTASTWHHIALSKDNAFNITRLFVDGILQGTYSDTNNYPQRPVVIGARYDGVFGFYGYIDTLRISKGISRFTSDFPPRTGFIPNDPYNVLFLRFNGTAGSSTIIDDAYGTSVSSSSGYLVSGVPSGSGTNALFSVFRTGGSSPSYTVNNVNSGSNYSPTETITVDGSLLGGLSSTNNLTITVTTVGGSGQITGFNFVGTASSGNAFYAALTPQNSGTNAQFIASKSGSNYSVQIENNGFGYYPGYELKVLGTSLGGTTPSNDLKIQIDSVETEPNDFILGKIVSSSAIGTPVVGSAITFYPSVALSEFTSGIITSSTTINYSSLARILVNFPGNHGLVPGDTALVSITSGGANHSLAAGPRIIDSVPALNQLVYTVSSPGTISSGISGSIYPRPDCFYIHRPFDGGVQLGTGGPAHGAHAIRQSKKYLRYQSGKGIMYTTGTLFAPAYDLRSITATGISTGSVITVTTDDNEHGLQIGAEIILNDITTSGYDGNYIVNGILNETSFTILASQQLGSTTAELGSQAQVSLYKWKGATVRAGAFDDQNGIFWQYDGVNLSVGLRSATYQLAGTIAINSESNTVVGTNTRFREQLIVGNRIVIRGMTHVVTNIQSNTQMTVTPDFRGVSNVSGVKAALVNEIIIPQHQWNIDRADGTGPSGYHIEVNKMQMIGFQYTWYGAGFIDWMLRGPNGDYLFVHRLKNNNRNTEAFMRSGNLPVRYEVINEGAKTRLTQNVGVGSTVLYIDNVELLPSSGSLYIDNEIINYTGVQTATNSLTGLTRGATFSNFYSGSQRSYTAGVASTHTSGTGIVLLSNTATPVISHWGSAFLTDGLFDQDRGYIFNYQSVNFSIITTRATAFLIRLAPSVSNAIVGDLGQRELINRAQLLLQGIEFTATGGSANQAVVIEGVLNPQNYPTNPNNINWFSLSNSAGGGQPSFAQIANGSSVIWSGGASSFTATNSVAGSSYTNRTLVYFTPASIVNAKVGQIFSGTGVPGGTLVRGIFDSSAFPGNKYVELSQAVSAPGAIGASTYTFSDPNAAAVPGETVFSFIASGGGGNTASLDLSNLKELNNTPIGGRGTFPNGPDVLAINVYTTSGTSFTGSLVLRWGEAQA
jgi:hypothetical protein